MKSEYQVALDFLVAMKADKSQVAKAAQTISDTLQGAVPDIEIDTDSVKKMLDMLVDGFEDAESNAKLLEKSLQGLEMDIDSEGIERFVSDVSEALESLNDMDLNKFEEAVEKLSTNPAFEHLDDVLNNISVEKFNSSMEKLSDTYEEQVSELKKLLNTQENAAKLLKSQGQEGTEAYKKLTKQIEETKEAVSMLEDESSGDWITRIGEKHENLKSMFSTVDELGGKFAEFSEKGMEYQRSLLQLSAAAGVTGDELDNLSDIAKEVYKYGVGENLSEAVKTIAIAKRSLGEFLDDSQIKDFTTGAYGLSKVYDKDVDEIINKSRSFIQNFKLEGQEAFELIALASQNTATAQDDLFDTLDEYSAHLVRAGFEGAESIGMMNKVIENGAWNTDKFADAIKETNIRIMEGDIGRELNELMTTFGTEMPKGLQQTLLRIQEMGQKGLLSTKEVLKQSAQAVQEGYDTGKISDVLRDKLARTFSGTMAEDLGGKFWTDVFGADYDKSAIEAKAQEAGQLMLNAIEPSTFADKIGRTFEAMTAEITSFAAPVAAEVGKALTATSQIAPSLMLFKDMPFGKIASQVKDIAITITNKLIPGLIVQVPAETAVTTQKIAQTVATEAATKSQLKFNIAALNNPYVKGAALLIGAVALIWSLADAFSKSAKEKLEENKAEQESLNLQMQSNEQRQKALQGNIDQAKSYEELSKKRATNTKLTADEEREYLRLQGELALAYPKSVSGTKDLTVSLSELKNQVANDTIELAKMKEEMINLRQESLKFKSEELQLNIAVKAEDLQDKLNDVSDAVGAMLIYTSEKTQKGLQEFDEEEFLAPFLDAMTNAKTKGEIEKARSQLEVALAEKAGLAMKNMTKQEQLEVRQAINAFYTESIKSFEEKQKIANEQLDTYFSDEFFNIDKNKLAMKAEELGVPFETAQDKMITYGAKMVLQGESEEKVIKSLSKQLNLQPPIVQELVNKQKASKEMTQMQISEAKKLTQAWNDARNAAQESLDVLTDEIAMLLQKQKAGTLSAAESASLLEKKNKAISLKKQINEVDLYKQKAKELYDPTVKATQAAQSQYDIEMALLAKKNENLKKTAERLEKEEEINIVLSGRESTVYDEILAKQRGIELLKQESSNLQEVINKLSIYDKKTGALIGYKGVSKKEFAKIRDEFQGNLDDLNYDIVQANREMQVLKIKVATSEEEYLKRLEEFKRTKLQKEVEVGLIMPKDYLEILKQDLKKITDQISQNKELQDGLKLKLNSDVTEQEALKLQAQLQVLNTKILELNEAQFNKEQEINDQRVKMYDESAQKLQSIFDDLMSESQKKSDEQAEQLERFIEIYTQVNERALKLEESRKSKDIDTWEESKVKELERRKDLLAEVDYNLRLEQIKEAADKRRDDLQKQLEIKRKNDQARLQGLEMESERERQNKDLSNEKKHIEAQIELMEEKANAFSLLGEPIFTNENDKKAYEKLKKQLDDTTNLLDVKGTEVGVLATDFQTSIQDIINNIGPGSGEDIEKVWGSYLNRLAGFLQAKASGFVLDLVLSESVKGYLSGLPFPFSVISIPIITTMVNKAVKFITDPLIKSVLSFATGARIDQPTLAVIGDGADKGGLNREWILRDEQLIATVQMAVNMQNNALAMKIDSLINLLSGQKLTAKLTGQDMLIAIQRTQATNAARGY